MAASDVIETKNLVKRYKDGHLAIGGMTLRLSKKNTVILGRNGAGKTTLLRILSTQLLSTSGEVKVLGHDVNKEPEKVRAEIVSIPQEAEVINFLTPKEHLEIYLAARGYQKDVIEKKIERALKTLGLYEERDKMTHLLSGGMKRKIFVAMALASDAKLTFLDEPTIALDPISRMEVWAAIKHLKGNVILTTHYMEEAKILGDEIVLVDNGSVVMQGPVVELLRERRGLVRVDGVSHGKLQFEIGGVKISYLQEKEALAYADRGYEVKQLDIEDLFILGGSK